MREGSPRPQNGGATPHVSKEITGGSRCSEAGIEGPVTPGRHEDLQTPAVGHELR